MSESKVWLVFWLIISLGFLTPEACARYEESKVSPGDIWVYCPESEDPFESVECDTTYVLQTKGNYALWTRGKYETSSRKRYVARSGAFRIKEGQ